MSPMLQRRNLRAVIMRLEEIELQVQAALRECRAALDTIRSEIPQAKKGAA